MEVGYLKNKQRLELLHGVSGVVKPGEMLAIIGGSGNDFVLLVCGLFTVCQKKKGAGKTTLLDILAGRKSTGEITGEIMFNGTSGKELKDLLKRITGYVTQEDVLQSTLTVRETLSFFAELRLDPREYTPQQRLERIDTVLSQLGLTHRADARVGDIEKRGLSGGERKRVAIGCQLVADPSVLFLDEPTSGLDAFNSLHVVQLLRELCAMGKTVVATIHQPRSSIFDLFDQLLILDHGSAVYFGKAQAAVPYFAGYGFETPEHANPADYFVDVILSSPDARQAMSMQNMLVVDFPKAYLESPAAASVLATVEESRSQYPDLSMRAATTRPFATSTWKQFQELTKRTFKTTARNPLAAVVNLITAVILSFIIGSIFYQIPYDQAAIQARTGAIFFVMIQGAFGISQATIAFIQERLVVNRERASGMYTAGPYFVAKVIVDVPVHVLQTILAR